MLKSLYIHNYAIIRELRVDFNPGFSTLTGETGAGKSILLGALSLILGQRADTAVLLDKEKKCIIEGIFTGEGKALNAMLMENDLDPDRELIIRREISSNGKSRAFVNDTPVNLPLLRDLGYILVDIHNQYENLNLSQQKYQLEVLDAFGNLGGKTLVYRNVFAEYRSLQHEYNQLLKEQEQSLSRLDYVQFQYDELEKARIREGELEEAESELEVLQHAEDIKENLFLAWKKTEGEEISAISLLKEAQNALERISGYHNPTAALSERLATCLIELRDISAEAEKLAEKTDYDPELLRQLEERLNLLNSLLQKHHLKNESELIGLRDQYSKEIQDLSTMEFRLEELKKEINGSEQNLRHLAGEISSERKSSAQKLRDIITGLLKELGIPNARFIIELSELGQLSETGIDRAGFLFSANRNTPLQELSKVASGGELSRLMLSIKSVISHSIGMPTIIFDEIDTGVSGEIAHRIGLMMKKMALDRQVLSVTHLPQVAACGTYHYFVYKEDIPEGTETLMKELNRDERVVEIAKMLSGEATTEAALENARDLLKS